MAKCGICFRQCDISEGGRGFCGARTCKDGVSTPLGYGLISSLSLDPVEKKPLARFFPGKYVLSVGGYGCNLRCPFCQNYQISWSDECFSSIEKERNDPEHLLMPQELCDLALRYVKRGNIGVAYTYNEPLVAFEYVRDTAKLVNAAGMKNILVTNGSASLQALEEILPYIDAMNIDLKGFTADYYKRLLKGDLDTVCRFIKRAAKDCHVELTTLIIPGENDSDEEMRALTSFIASITDKDGNATGCSIPLHISRFFPTFKMQDRNATDIGRIYHLAEVAREKLKYVYTGNC